MSSSWYFFSALRYVGAAAAAGGATYAAPRPSGHTVPFPWHSDAVVPWLAAAARMALGALAPGLPWLACAALVALQPIYRFNFIKLAGSYSLGTPHHPSPTCHLNCFTEFSWVTITLFSFFCYGENSTDVQWGIFLLEVEFEAICIWCRWTNIFLSQILEIWKCKWETS